MLKEYLCDKTFLPVISNESGHLVSALMVLHRNRSPVLAGNAGAGNSLSSTDSNVKNDLSGEYANILLLLVLYTLQGIPMGLGPMGLGRLPTSQAPLPYIPPL